jgi:hypothetical protein
MVEKVIELIGDEVVSLNKAHAQDTSGEHVLPIRAHS